MFGFIVLANRAAFTFQSSSTRTAVNVRKRRVEVIRDFLDTSVLVAAFWGDHVHYGSSVEIFARARKVTTACAAHSVAELYSKMTSLPVRPPISPDQTLLFLEPACEIFALRGVAGSGIHPEDGFTRPHKIQFVSRQQLDVSWITLQQSQLFALFVVIYLLLFDLLL